MIVHLLFIVLGAVVDYVYCGNLLYVVLISYSQNYIDVRIIMTRMANGGWRIYGLPEGVRMRQSWGLLRQLAQASSLPC